MKKKLLILLLLVFSIALASCASVPTLKLYNWGEFMDPSLVAQFEEETGYRVKQIAFNSNEMAITQIKAGNQFDLVIPSDYAIEQLAAEGLIMKLDWSRITTFDYETDLAQGLKNILDKLNQGDNGFDLLEYAAPYFWGNVGILYNHETVDQANLDGWNTLKNNQYRIAFYNSARDAFMPALKAIGAQSINSPTTAEFEAAVNWLEDALTKDTDVITDEIFDAMLDPARYDMVVAYSGDANYLMSENDKLSFYVPEQGTNVFVDAFVLPNGANEYLAYKFISFMLSFDSALQNTEYVMYSTPRQDVFDYVLAEGGSFAHLADSYNIRINENDEVYRFNLELKTKLDTSWQEILAGKGYTGEGEQGLGLGGYVAIALISGLVVSSVVLAVAKLKKRA